MKHKSWNICLWPTLTASALALGLLAPTTANADSATCSSLNNFILDDNSSIYVDVHEGDVFSLTAWEEIASEPYFAPYYGPEQFGELTYIQQGSTVAYTVPSVVAGVYFFRAPVASRLTISCTVAPTGASAADALVTTASVIGASGQTNATRTGISSNTQNRLNGGGGNTATRNSIFLSTQNLPGAQSQFGQPEWNAWISAEGRSYSGDFDGWTGNAVAGLDTLISNDLLVGALLAYGRTDIQSATQQTEITSVALGAYFAKRLQSDLFLDGFVSVARPEYQTQGTAFSSSRTSASLSLTGNYTGGALNVTPFAKFGAYSEQQPAYTGTGGAVAANDITNISVALGAKVEPLAATASGILPYISLGLDYGSNTGTISGTSAFMSPRIGVGGGMDIASGHLSVDVDAGKVQEGVRDLGLRATYEFSF
jgi:hypothetical protein